jgi:hypothetical protein
VTNARLPSKFEDTVGGVQVSIDLAFATGTTAAFLVISLSLAITSHIEINRENYVIFGASIWRLYIKSANSSDLLLFLFYKRYIINYGRHVNSDLSSYGVIRRH